MLAGYGCGRWARAGGAVGGTTRGRVGGRHRHTAGAGGAGPARAGAGIAGIGPMVGPEKRKVGTNSLLPTPPGSCSRQQAISSARASFMPAYTYEFLHVLLRSTCRGLHVPVHLFTREEKFFLWGKI
jgi:hypothetical protein